MPLTKLYKSDPGQFSTSPHTVNQHIPPPHSLAHYVTGLKKRSHANSLIQTRNDESVPEISNFLLPHLNNIAFSCSNLSYVRIKV